VIDQKQLGNVECFNYLVTMITNDARANTWQKQYST
jgi:hypothetical protein